MQNQPPDFDEFMKVVESIGELTERVEMLEAFLKVSESEITKACTTDSKYFDDKGKPPSMVFIQNRYHYIGLDGELVDKRYELATLKGQKIRAELKFKVLYGMLELYRTESANKRTMVT